MAKVVKISDPSTAQNAIREARLLGLIVVAGAAAPGQPSLTNIVRIIGQEWRSWLRLGDKGSPSQRVSTVDVPLWKSNIRGARKNEPYPLPGVS